MSVGQVVAVVNGDFNVDLESSLATGRKEGSKFTYGVLHDVLTEIVDEMGAIVDVVGTSFVAGQRYMISQNDGEDGGQENLGSDS